MLERLQMIQDNIKSIQEYKPTYYDIVGGYNLQKPKLLKELYEAEMILIKSFNKQEK
jgi:hypothetical protein